MNHKIKVIIMCFVIMIAVLLITDVIFFFIVLPAIIALLIAGIDISKGNLPNNIAKHKTVWKDNRDMGESKEFFFPNCTILQDGIGYLNYFAKFEDITSLRPFLKSKLKYVVAGVALFIINPRYGLDFSHPRFYRVRTKKKTIIMEIVDEHSFLRELKKLGIFTDNAKL
jgi:Kef-type K+ transport system membrane component KefB